MITNKEIVMLEDYDCMRKVINSFIKNTGVDIILSNAEYSGLLHVFYYNWLSTDGKYYSLLAPCSTNHCYSPSLLEQQPAYSLRDALARNLRIFNNKEEWHQGMWTKEQALSFDKALRKELLVDKNNLVEVGGYKVRKMQVHVQPELGVSIWYEKDVLDCITVWYTTKISIGTTDPLFKVFIDSLGFNKYVQVNLIQEKNLGIGVSMDECV